MLYRSGDRSGWRTSRGENANREGPALAAPTFSSPTRPMRSPEDSTWWAAAREWSAKYRKTPLANEVVQAVRGQVGGVHHLDARAGHCGGSGLSERGR